MSKKSLSRRDFLKAAAATTGAAALGIAPSFNRRMALAQDVYTLTAAHAWETAFMPHQLEWDAIFMKANPDIKITDINNTWGDHQTIVPTWAAAGQLPDILYVHGSRAFPWAKEGITIDIQSRAEADTAFDLAGMFQEAVRLYKYNGNLHALPYDHGPVILGYNKDMFDAAGVAYPAEDWTMDDFKAAMMKFIKPGEQWGFGGYYGSVGFGNEAGGAHLFPWEAALFKDDETGLVIDFGQREDSPQFLVRSDAQGSRHYRWNRVLRASPAAFRKAVQSPCSV